MSPLPSPRIAALNDAFRSTMHQGTVLLTRGVAQLSPAEVSAVILLVREFDAFDDGNDPYNEHDFGSVTFRHIKYFWKIEYFRDARFTEPSPDPADPALTHRVLHIMRADEY